MLTWFWTDPTRVLSTDMSMHKSSFPMSILQAHASMWICVELWKHIMIMQAHSRLGCSCGHIWQRLPLMNTALSAIPHRHYSSTSSHDHVSSSS